jgi:hypothetical protein
LAVLKGGVLDGKAYAVDSEQTVIEGMDGAVTEDDGHWARSDEDAEVPEELKGWCQAQGIEVAKVFNHVAP